MSPVRLTRRRFLAAPLAAAAVLPFGLAPFGVAQAAPFVSNRITVRIEGKGPDVVLVPGLNSSPRAWASTVAALPGYRYHLVQVSGFAGQPAGANASGDVVAPVAEEIARYITETRLERPALVGHSLGGSLAMMVAARHPELVSRLMVVDIAPYMGLLFAGPNASPAAVQAIAERMRAGILAESLEAHRAHVEKTIAGYVDTVAMRPIAIEDALASDRAVGAHAFGELIVTDLRPELQHIAVPVTVLYAMPAGVAVAPAVIDAGYRNWYAPIQQAVLKRIPDSAHFIMWDQPARFQAELKTFLGAA